MNDAAELERSYRRWLRWYPRRFRREHEAEILGVLMADAEVGRRRPEIMECLDLVRSGLGVRLRPRLADSERSAIMAVRLMYLGALTELATGITVSATTGEIRSNILRRDPGFTGAQWHSLLAGELEPLVIAAGIAVVFSLWIAWANGRGHLWARILFALFFALNSVSLINGLTKGSAVYAPADLAAGTVLCLVQLAAVVLLSHAELGKIKGSR